MPTLKLYDPALCCSTGVCGAEVDQQLVDTAALIDWAKKQGAVIERFNLAKNPEAFANNPQVSGFLQTAGSSALPLVILDDQIFLAGRYPSKNELCHWLGINTANNCCASQETEATCC